MEYLYELGNRREWNELEKVLHEILSCDGFHKLKAQALEYAVFMGLQRKEQRQALGGCPACFLILKGVVISSHETNRFS